MIGTDTKTDLALLKVEPKKPLTAARFGDSDKMRVGDWVIAIGNPFGLGGTVTAGIISARERDINSGPYDDYLQTDAAINRGNSGGPLFNIDGEVIGVNTAIISPSGGSIGIGFAVPSNLAVPVIDQLQAVRRDAARLARRAYPERHRRHRREHGAARAAGALVASVAPDSPAAVAGLQPSDIILKFDGQPDRDHAQPAEARLPDAIGKDVDVECRQRAGEVLHLTVTVGRPPRGSREGRSRSRASLVPMSRRRSPIMKSCSASRSPRSPKSCAINSISARASRAW